MSRAGLLTRCAAVLALGAALVFGGASTSSAATMTPAVDGPGCTDVLAAEYPNGSTTGTLLPTPKNHKYVNPFGPKGHTTTLFEQYGFAGLVWHPFDLGCAGEMKHPVESGTNFAANAVLSADKDAAAFYLMPLQWMDDRAWLSSLDPMLKQVSNDMRDHLLIPVLPVTLGLVGLGILLGSHRRGATSKTGAALAWALLVTLVGIGVGNYPLVVSHKYDQVVDGMMTKASGLIGYDNKSASQAMAGVMTEQILWPAWLQGEFGNKDSAVARKYGPALYRAQAFSRAEVAKLQAADKSTNRAKKKYESMTYDELVDELGMGPMGPIKCRPGAILGAATPECKKYHEVMASNGSVTARRSLQKQKVHDFSEAAGKVKSEDPTAYDNVAGHQSGADGFGAAMLAGIQIHLIGPFPFVAGLLVVFSLVIMKFVVMMLPGVAVFLVLKSTQGYAIAVAKRLLIAVFAAPIFTALAMVDVFWVTHVFDASASTPLKVMFATAGAVLLWILSKPVRSMRAMLTGNATSQHAVLGRILSFASSFLGAKEGVEAGTKEREETGTTPRRTATAPSAETLEEGRQPVTLRRELPGSTVGAAAALPAGRVAEEDIVDAEIVDDDMPEAAPGRRPAPYVITAQPAAALPSGAASAAPDYPSTVRVIDARQVEVTDDAARAAGAGGQDSAVIAPGTGGTDERSGSRDRVWVVTRAGQPEVSDQRRRPSDAPGVAGPGDDRRRAMAEAGSPEWHPRPGLWVAGDTRSDYGKAEPQKVSSDEAPPPRVIDDRAPVFDPRTETMTTWGELETSAAQWREEDR